MSIFNEDFREFIEILNEFEVEYMLIGGHAVNIYGYRRSTGDMDIWINKTNENKLKLISVIEKFGFDSEPLNEKDFSETLMFHFGTHPNRIEITNKIAGIDFEESYLKRNEVEFEGVKLKLIHLSDLKYNKLRSGRLKDLSDLEELNKFENE